MAIAAYIDRNCLTLDPLYQSRRKGDRMTDNLPTIEVRATQPT